jgi:hypothetical protein
MVLSHESGAWVQCIRDAKDQASLDLRAEHVLPDAQDSPSPGPKCLSNQPVTGPIGGQFSSPECRVGLGFPAVAWASMPEAAVDENGNAFLSEHKVGFAEQALMPAPAGDPVATENGYECNFGRLVAFAADAGHDLGPLGL